MRRTGWITVLTVAGIVAAAGTAAALNARVLDSSGSGSVGTAETFVELDEQPEDDPSSIATPSAGSPSATAATSQRPTALPSASSARPTAATSTRPSTSRPSASATDDSSGRDDSDDRDDSSGKGSGSDDEPDDD